MDSSSNWIPPRPDLSHDLPVFDWSFDDHCNSDQWEPTDPAAPNVETQSSQEAASAPAAMNLRTQPSWYTTNPQPRPSRMAVFAPEITTLERRSPQEAAGVPNLTDFEKSLVQFFVLQGIWGSFEIWLHIHRCRALRERGDVRKFPDQRTKVREERKIMLKNLLGMRGTSPTSLRTVREDAQALVSRLKRHLASQDWDHLKLGYMFGDVGEAVLASLLSRACSDRPYEHDSTAPVGYNAQRAALRRLAGKNRQVSGKHIIWTSLTPVVQSWYNEDERRNMREHREKTTRDETVVSRAGRKGVEEKSTGTTPNLDSLEQVQPKIELDFEIMVDNAVRIWDLPMHWGR